MYDSSKGLRNEEEADLAYHAVGYHPTRESIIECVLAEFSDS
jgi:hypothetical protein